MKGGFEVAGNGSLEGCVDRDGGGMLALKLKGAGFVFGGSNDDVVVDDEVEGNVCMGFLTLELSDVSPSFWSLEASTPNCSIKFVA